MGCLRPPSACGCLMRCCHARSWGLTRRAPAPVSARRGRVPRPSSSSTRSTPSAGSAAEAARVQRHGVGWTGGWCGGVWGAAGRGAARCAGLCRVALGVAGLVGWRAGWLGGLAERRHPPPVTPCRPRRRCPARVAGATGDFSSALLARGPRRALAPTAPSWKCEAAGETPPTTRPPRRLPPRPLHLRSPRPPWLRPPLMWAPPRLSAASGLRRPPAALGGGGGLRLV